MIRLHTWTQTWVGVGLMNIWDNINNGGKGETKHLENVFFFMSQASKLLWEQNYHEFEHGKINQTIAQTWQDEPRLWPYTKCVFQIGSWT